MPDLFFYRDPEEAEKEEQARREALAAQAPAGKVEETWGGGEEMTTDWANEPAPGLGAPAPPAAAAPGDAGGFSVSDDWANQTAATPAAVPQSSDWAAEAPAAVDPSNQWGGSSNWN